MVGLQLGENLNDSLFPSGLGHEELVVWSGEPFVLDSNRIDGLHPVPQLVVVLGHKGALVLQDLAHLVRVVLEDDDLALLLEVDLIEQLNARSPRVEVVVEVADVLTCKSLQFADLEDIGHRLLDR